MVLRILSFCLCWLLVMAGASGFIDSYRAYAAPSRNLVVNPTQIAFGKVPMGSVQAATVSITNSAANNIKVTSADVSGTGFSISGIKLPLVLAAGKSVSLKVTFSPQTVGDVTGIVKITSNATNSSISVSLSGSGIEPLQVTSLSLANAQQGATYRAQLSVAGGASPFEWAVVAGSLPGGLELTAATGEIVGTPATAGQSTFTVQVRDSSVPRQTATANLGLVVTSASSPLMISTVHLPNATNRMEYAATLSASGGQGPYSWKLDSSVLPSGLTLEGNTGEISGIPTVTGPVNFTVVLADAAQQSARSELLINVLPELPRTTVDTTFPNQAGPAMQVNAGGDLQAAINSAPCGSTIRVQAGATFQGKFILPNKGCTAAGWIVITSDSPDLPPPGTRVTVADAGTMPKIVAGFQNIAAIKSTSPAAGVSGGTYWRLVGLEVTASDSVTTSSNPFSAGLVEFGSTEVGADQPHHNIIDRCYIHGSATQYVKRGVLLNGAHQAVIDSTIAEIHLAGQDSQAILSYNGPGPFKIENSRLEAAAENIMFGGAIGGNLDNVPSDIEIRNNHLLKPLEWQSSAWSVKNLLELKNARRVLIEGNVLENNWAQSQVGFAVLFTPRGPASSQGGESATTSELTFINNLILHVGGGFNIAGTDSQDTEPRPIRGKNIAIMNNVVLDANDLPLSLQPFGAGGTGRLFQVLSGVVNLTIEHNTGFGTHSFVFADLGNVLDRKNAPTVIRNNLFQHGRYGLFCSNYGTGTAGLEACFNPPAYIFSRNLVLSLPAGVATTRYPDSNMSCNASGDTCYPITPGEIEMVDAENCNAGDFDFRACALLQSSPYWNAGEGGRNLGADTTKIPSKK